MGKGTDIQWCDDTRNPVGGCDGCELHNTKQGIKYCYAGVLTLRRKGHAGFARDFDTPQMFPGRMAEAARASDLTGTKRPGKPWLTGPRYIFVSDMGDALSKDIPFEYLREEIVDVATSPNGSRHVWQWLTKQPLRMAAFFKWLAEREILWPTNLWIGTSITSNAHLKRIDALLKVGDAKTTRFVSLEPQFEAVTLPHLSSLDWVIQGGLSGSGDYPFDLQWARDTRDACAASSVAYFLKQFGARAVFAGRPFSTKGDLHGGDWTKWPEDLRVRQMPSADGNMRRMLPTST